MINTVIDTSIAIERYKNGEEIPENITIVTAMEFPPILNYKGLKGKIYTITPEDQVLAIKLQRLMRKIGKPKSVPDLLIAAICINRGEKLVTKDSDFSEISEVSDLTVEIL
ncbi:PIN domain-containing protein [Geoglobus sp.]